MSEEAKAIATEIISHLFAIAAPNQRAIEDMTKALDAYAEKKVKEEQEKILKIPCNGECCEIILANPPFEDEAGK